MRTRILAAAAVAGAIALTAAAGVALLADDGGSAGTPDVAGGGITAAPDGTVVAAGLERSDSCAALAANMEELAAEHGSQPGMGGPIAMALQDEAEATDSGTDQSARAPSDGDDATNVQEAGVDEPDIVERLGSNLVVTGTEGTLRVLDVSGGTPVARGQLELQQWAGDLGLLAISDTRVAVLAAGEGQVRKPLADGAILPGGWQSTIVTLVDVSDPDQPQELSRAELEGFLVEARAVDGVLRLAVRSDGPRIDPFANGELPRGRDLDIEDAAPEEIQRYQEQQQAAYEEALAEARARLEPEDWQPHAEVDGSTVPLVACDRIGFPTSFAGLGTLTVAMVDATGDALAVDDAEAVVTSGENLYATADRVVVATTRWVPCCEPVPNEQPQPEGEPQPEEPFFEEGAAPATARSTVRALTMPVEPGPWPGGPWPGGGATDLHVFDTEGTLVSHVASGSVDGSLLNQYSMSIHDGVLRAATTARTDDGSTESRVTTFRVEGTDLVQLGQVGDLGPDEDIQAVRFMGETGYVVTFRRTDPLYVVDLSDPAAPTTRGELKIEGYSAHLQPLGDGQLLGVGQDADPETGRTRGVQVSTFDVTDPTAPSRIDVEVLPASSTPVEFEPLALTVTDDRLSLVPIEQWRDDAATGTYGTLVHEVAGDGQLDRVGLLNTGSDWRLRPRRTLDLGDVLLTIGDGGVVAWDRDGFAALNTLRFDTPAADQRHGEPGFEEAG